MVKGFWKDIQGFVDEHILHIDNKKKENTKKDVATDKKKEEVFVGAKQAQLKQQNKATQSPDGNKTALSETTSSEQSTLAVGDELMKTETTGKSGVSVFDSSLKELIEKEESDGEKRRLWGDNDPTIKDSSTGKGIAIDTSDVFSVSIGSPFKATSLILALVFVCVAVTLPLLARRSPVMDGLCSPAMPGLKLTTDNENSSIRLEAPWWAPHSYKSQAFDLVCGGDRSRTALEWTPEKNKGKGYRLALLALEKGEFDMLIGKEKRRLASAVANPRDIVLVDLKGKKEELSGPWKLDHIEM